MLSFSGASILWSHISDNIGNRLVLLISGICAVALPAMILLAPRIPQAPLLPGSGVDLRGGYFVLVFVVAGLFLSSQFLGQNNYLLEISDGRTRPTYLGFYFSILIPLAWMPLVRRAKERRTKKTAERMSLPKLIRWAAASFPGCWHR